MGRTGGRGWLLKSKMGGKLRKAGNDRAQSGILKMPELGEKGTNNVLEQKRHQKSEP